ncbi:MAG: right-handed parallel beta-helix repeat-containing protein [Candidatus Sumerlaeota bacterium]|nr:right-handed parallel beta-helix repeat-containing protein [Candidatus Sumerlaeota bacterium]
MFIRQGMTMAALLATVLYVATAPIDAATITVHPGQSIQTALDAASNGDTIIVEPGTYDGFIHFFGKNVTLRSTDPTNATVVATTIIDGKNASIGVVFGGSESASCVLSGFTISHGEGDSGGGVWGNGTHATIENNRIVSNRASGQVAPAGGVGGGLHNCDGLIRDNYIADNWAHYEGGGLALCDGEIRDNEIRNNRADSDGGGMYMCGGTIADNEITGNSAMYYGPAIHDCDGTILGNTITGNSRDDVPNYFTGAVAYCSGQIEGNLVSSNLRSSGLSHCYYSVIQYNTVSDNDEGGIRGCYGATIRGNRVTENELFGLMQINGPFYGETTGNLIARNIGPGIDASAGLIEDNVVLENAGAGISYFAGLTRNNTVCLNDADGFYGCDTVIEGNKIVGNGGNGIYWASDLLSFVHKNSIVGNADWGIDGSSKGRVRNNVIAYNASGIQNYSDGRIENNTICSNKTASAGVGVKFAESSVLRNCIVWDNNPLPGYPQIAYTSSPTYCCIQDWASATDGNINASPQFLSDGFAAQATTLTYRPADFQTTALIPGAGFTPGAHTGRIVRVAALWSVVAGNEAESLSIWGDLTAGGSVVAPVAVEILRTYRLTAGSPCANAGGGIADLVEDMEGDPRPYPGPELLSGDGSNYDMGADEYFVRSAGLGAPDLAYVEASDPGTIRLMWRQYNQVPLQYLGFAWDIYNQSWVLGGWQDTLWRPFPYYVRWGDVSLGMSGAYHAWISALYAGGDWRVCDNPWTGILYAGTPNTPRDAWAESLGGGRARLHWRPEIYGTWHNQIAAYHVQSTWVETQGPSGFGLWHFVDYGGMGYQAGKADFFAGWADFSSLAAGDYWFFIRGMAWDATTGGEFAAAGVHVP